MEDNYYKAREPYFGSWVIERKLGQGASGKVFLISMSGNTSEPEYSALKAISIPSNEAEAQSLMAEVGSPEEANKYYEGFVKDVVSGIKLVKNIEDKSHVVDILEYEVVPKTEGIGYDIFIRMEFLTSLVNIMNEQEFTEDKVLALGVDICSALEECEKAHVIHRDVKPENIFITKDGRYKLGDFGIAKITNKTEVGVSRKGTIEYMAPEVYNGEICDKSVDLYSLGLVMYKLLNRNRTPFMPPYPEPIMYVDRERAFAKRMSGGIITPPINGSEGLKNAVLTACAFIKTERFRCAADMKEALLTGVQRPKKRIKIWPFIAAVLVIAVAIAFPKGVTDITGVKPSEIVFLGETVQHEYGVEPFIYKNAKISFEADSDVVSTDEDCCITGRKVGTATVTVKAGKHKEKIEVTVLPTVSDFTGVDKEISLTEGDTKEIKPEIVPNEGASDVPEDISMKIKDKDVVSLSGNTLTAKKPGNTTLTISAGGFDKTYKIEVEKKPEPVIYVNTHKGKKKAKHKGGGTFTNDTYF